MPVRSTSRLLATVAALALVAGALLATGVIGGDTTAGGGSPRVRDEVPVTPMDQSLGASNNSPLILVDPTEPRFVAMANRLDAPDFSCALQLSGDGGRGWVPANPVPKLPPKADKCYAPEIAFGDDGTLYYLFVGLEGTGNEPMGAFLTSTSDRGRTFGEPRRVLGPLNFGVRMAFDPDVGRRGRLHLAWVHATSDPPTGGFGPPPNPILTAHSDDGGRTFSEPVTIAGADGERVAGPALTLGPDGTVHLAWFDLGGDAPDYQGLEGPVWDGTWSLRASRSTDRGATFGPPVDVDDAIVPHERVMLIFTMAPASVVADGRRMCAAWTDARRGDADAVLRCSTDGGRRWGPLRRLNDDRPGTGRWQYLPRLSLSPDGRLDAVFFDRRADPNNAMVEVYATFSEDGGRRFARNLQISNESFASDIGQQYAHAAAAGQYEFGSRLGLLSRPAGALAAWPDTRNSRPASSSQDLFVALLELPGPDDTDDGPRLAGVGLLVAGALALGAAVVGRRRATRATGTAGTAGTAGPDGPVAAP